MKHWTSLAAITVVAGTLCASSAQAQGGNEITMVAPQPTVVSVDRTNFGAPPVEIAVTHKVTYRDLDLRTQNGVSTLYRRIRVVAKDACEELNDLYPNDEATRGCVWEAVYSTQGQVDAAVRRARNG